MMINADEFLNISKSSMHEENNAVICNVKILIQSDGLIWEKILS